ncbi:hypothetical protein NW739_01255 [Mycoplasmopsis felis]|uniref:hypothetical protein n=1 Tax=Mycoplasmopsis felis TaxID=33923 RepID=UPI0021E00FC8|nr:hypothetical protein [Mycoplasmopsis felis]MCU9939438.1 hypothetical protein [Mycoplasmopsis felis]
MIVFKAIWVFPVWRSPMINSRWPLPIGINKSIATIPVNNCSFNVLTVVKSWASSKILAPDASVFSKFSFVGKITFPSISITLPKKFLKVSTLDYHFLKWFLY